SRLQGQGLEDLTETQSKKLEEFFLQNEQLRKRSPNEQIVVPKNKREELLKQYHDLLSSGHLGAARVYEKLKRHYWWSGMKKQVEEWVKECPRCQEFCSWNYKTVPMEPIEASEAWELVGMDLVGPMPK